MVQVQAHWEAVYRASTPMEAELLAGMLNAADIPAGMKGPGVAGAIGEIPVDALETPVYCAPEHFVMARDLLAQYEAEAREPTADWHCHECGEENAGTFELCWQCNTPREPMSG